MEAKVCKLDRWQVSLLSEGEQVRDMKLNNYLSIGKIKYNRD
jgi:hypothetical protein